MNQARTQEMHRVVAEVMCYHLRNEFSECGLQALANVEVKAHLEQHARRMVLDVLGKFLAKRFKDETVESVERFEFKAPLDWWQALRERWFPRWWLRRWPVKYRVEHKEVDRRVTVQHYCVCPHVRVPEHQRHVEFLMLGSNADDDNFSQGRT